MKKNQIIYEAPLFPVFNKHIFAYALELPCRGNSNEYAQYMFFMEIEGTLLNSDGKVMPP